VVRDAPELASDRGQCHCAKSDQEDEQHEGKDNQIRLNRAAHSITTANIAAAESAPSAIAPHLMAIRMVRASIGAGS